MHQRAYQRHIQSALPDCIPGRWAVFLSHLYGGPWRNGSGGRAEPGRTGASGADWNGRDETDWNGPERAGLERVGRGGRLVAAATHLLPAICYLLPATCSGPSASTGFHPIASRYFHKLLTINKLPQLTLRLGASKSTQRQPCFCKLLIISGPRK